MPWHKEAKKDVTTDDMLRLGGSSRRPADFRMGKPIQSNVWISISESIGYEKLTRRTETSKYPEEKKITMIS